MSIEQYREVLSKALEDSLLQAFITVLCRDYNKTVTNVIFELGSPNYGYTDDVYPTVHVMVDEPLTWFETKQIQMKIGWALMERGLDVWGFIVHVIPVEERISRANA